MSISNQVNLSVYVDGQDQPSHDVEMSVFDAARTDDDQIYVATIDNVRYFVNVTTKAVETRNEEPITNTFSILRAVQRLELDIDVRQVVKVSHVERDDPNYVTVYGEEQDGQLWYIVLSNELINQIKEL